MKKHKKTIKYKMFEFKVDKPLEAGFDVDSKQVQFYIGFKNTYGCGSLTTQCYSHDLSFEEVGDIRKTIQTFLDSDIEYIDLHELIMTILKGEE